MATGSVDGGNTYAFTRKVNSVPLTIKIAAPTAKAAVPEVTRSASLR